MIKQRITTVLALVTGLAPLLFGVNFLVNPGGAPDGFGIEPWPTGNASGYFMVKGIRDVSTATIIFILLAAGRRRTLGWVVLTTAVIPLGDALAVLTHGGALATALSVHVSAAALVALTAVLLLTESQESQESQESRGSRERQESRESQESRERQESRDGQERQEGQEGRDATGDPTKRAAKATHPSPRARR